MMTARSIVAAALLALVAAAAAPGTARADATTDGLNATVVQEWTELHLTTISATFGFLSPPGVARSLSMATTAMWDAAAAYSTDINPVMSDNGLGLRPVAERTQASVDTAIASAARTVLSDVFASQDQAHLDAFDALLEHFGGSAAASGTPSTSTPQGVGRIAAEAVLAFRHADGMNQLGDEPNTVGAAAYSDYTLYSPANDPQPALGLTDCALLRDINRWQPLRVPVNETDTTEGTTRTFLAPYMSNVKPFALDHASQFRPGPPPTRGSNTDAEFVAQHLEVLTESAALDDYKKVVAEFWADGPKSSLPPGHWHDITLERTRSDGLDLLASLKVLFVQAQAVFDAGVAAWDAKRHYDSARPVTVLQCLREGQNVTAWRGPYQGVGTIEGSRWQPYQDRTFVTPPFAEFVSGHSTFSTASAEVLKNFFGSDVFGGSYTVRAGESLFEPKRDDPSDPLYEDGVTNVPNSGPETVGYVPAADVRLSWATYSEAADEAGISRLYGGIHIRAGDLDGRTLGRQVGKVVWEKYESLLNAAEPAPSESDEALTKSEVFVQSFYGALAAGAVFLILALLLYLLVAGCRSHNMPQEPPRERPAAKASSAQMSSFSTNA